MPRPAQEPDPAARERLRAILESRSYVRADLDPDFLQRDEVRAARLHLDYLKAETILAEHGIDATVVVFGGTRIVERAAGERHLAAARKHLQEAPDDPVRQRAVRTAERVLARNRYYDIAREFAAIVSRAMPIDTAGAPEVTGDPDDLGEGAIEKRPPSRFVIMTGGGPGIMEAANRGAFEAGAKSIGLNITIPEEQYPNSYITPDLCFQFRYFAMRKLHFMMRARAMVAFPGGYGTLDELFNALCLIQTGVAHPLPVVLVGEEFWRRVFDAEFLADEGVIDPEDVYLFGYADDANDIWNYIRSWYESRPRSARS